MATPEKAHLQNVALVKHHGCGRSKAVVVFSQAFVYFSGVLMSSIVVWAIWSFFGDGANPGSGYAISTFSEVRCNSEEGNSSAARSGSGSGPVLRQEAEERNFYDDPLLRYTVDAPAVKNWDEKRAEWLRQHPSFAAGAEKRILMVTGSQATPCKSPVGDHLLLKMFKNKVDYCRRHGLDVFYNDVLLEPKMFSFWAKTPAVKAAMLAHPEAEWIWWVDADAVITDMDFKLPLERYRAHNFVAHGWHKLLNQKSKSWTSINAGVFLIRNCQWAMDFMEAWVKMGPQSPEYQKWGKILHQTFPDKIFPESDDQSGLIYLLLSDNEKWGSKMYVESEYYFEGYWVEIVSELGKVAAEYEKIENRVAALRRRHGEKMSEAYAEIWNEHLKDAGYGRGGLRRPFITHFTGCQPCSGAHNHIYSAKTCYEAMQKALIFADNQVLRNYGFRHPDPLNPATVVPLPFDYPRKHGF